jgi:hypothetical protein
MKGIRSFLAATLTAAPRVVRRLAPIRQTAAFRIQLIRFPKRLAVRGVMTSEPAFPLRLFKVGRDGCPSFFHP